MMRRFHFNIRHYAIPGMLLGILFLLVGCSSSSDNEMSNPSFDSGSIGPGETFSYTFKQEGTFDYYCSIHAPDMQGSVTVNSDASGSDQDTVEMVNTTFNPKSITVKPNTQVIWINRDDFAHTVVSGNPSSGSSGGGY